VSPLRQIIRGCGYVDGYGSHPGTGILIALVVMGGIAGAQGAGWRGFLFGACMMLLIFGPIYLFGAYDRGRPNQPKDINHGQ
jgi:hypothetical protein